MVSPRLIERADQDPCGALSQAIRTLRPELDLFKVTDETFNSVSASDTRCFRRVFYRQADYRELLLRSLKGIHVRDETPFVVALREYSH
jgi:arginine decarboxylase